MDNNAETQVREELTTSETKQPSESLGLQLSEVATNLGRALYEGNVDQSKRLTEAAQSFTKAKIEIEQETAKRASEAYVEYAKAAQEASIKEGGQQILVEAYQNYATLLSGLNEDACRRLRELHRDATAKYSEISEENRKRSRGQYVDYLKNLQRIWCGIDVEAFVQ